MGHNEGLFLTGRGGGAGNCRDARGKVSNARARTPIRPLGVRIQMRFTHERCGAANPRHARWPGCRRVTHMDAFSGVFMAGQSRSVRSVVTPWVAMDAVVILDVTIVASRRGDENKCGADLQALLGNGRKGGHSRCIRRLGLQWPATWVPPMDVVECAGHQTGMIATRAYGFSPRAYRADATRISSSAISRGGLRCVSLGRGHPIPSVRASSGAIASRAADRPMAYRPLPA